jgi:pseudouridine synthase
VEERLQKILARAGIASRRSAEVVMLEGRVTVNGEVVRELGSRADVGRDDIRVDGVRVKPPQEPVYLVLNKPKGVVTTRHDPEGRQTVMDLVPRVQGLFPVGRLDVGTEGLILLTNDGAFAERVAHPRYEVPRVYHAKVRGTPDEDVIRRMRAGVFSDGERLAADRVRLLEPGNNAWLEVTVHEGRHHEVKRLLLAVGHPVSKLRRVAFGPVTVRGLEPGQYRALTGGEIRALLGEAPFSAGPAPVRGRDKRRPLDQRAASERRAPRKGGASDRRGPGDRRHRNRGSLDAFDERDRRTGRPPRRRPRPRQP